VRRAALAAGLALALPAAAQEVAPGSRAHMRALDRIAGEARDLTVPVGGSAPLADLAVSVTECRYPVDNPAGDGFAHVVITDTASGGRLFDGWMIASAPALNPFDHMRYDVWLLRCSTS